MLAFSNDYYGMIFRATQSVELFCAYGQKIKNGTIVIVDAQGTFFQQEEPSYDIEVTNDLLDQNGLYKHIQQSWIL